MKVRTIPRRNFLAASLGLSLAGTRLAWGDDKGVKAAGSPQPKALATIEKARQAGLEALKPSRKDLEHGLELHRASVVFESYGFSPRCAVDGDVVRAAVEANASPLELQDLEENMSMTRCVTDAVERAEYMAAWEASGVTCIFQNAGEEGEEPTRLMKRLARFTYVTDMLRPAVSKVVTADDVLEAKKRGQRCLCFTGNGVPLPQQWVSPEEELRYIRVFFQLGIRMMHMTYQRRNVIGDGCAETANGGLSDFGRMVVGELNRVGVIPDVAHSGWQTSLETAKTSKRPVVASHTVCAGLNKHIRSKPDEVIRAIVDTGGYVGICSIPAFLGGKGDITAMLDHIDYVVKHYGADYVTIGTDVAASSPNCGPESKKIPKRPRSRPRWASLWPPKALSDPPGAAATMAWTNWPLFTVGMVQRGYRDEDIQKILGGNVLRVLRSMVQRPGETATKPA